MGRIYSIKDTLTKLNLDGANVKELKRMGRKLVVIKEPIQLNCTDNISEVMVYKLAKKMEIPCAEAGLLNDKRVYSVVDETVKDSLISADEFLKIDDGSIADVYSRLCRLPVSRIVKIAFLRMTLFDILTRQIDRNMTNFSFIVKGKTIKLYQLYDNGLSLFSTSSFSKKLNFMTRTRDYSNDVIDFCAKESANLHTSLKTLLKKKITKKDLLSLWKNYKGDTKNNLVDIIDWVLSQQDNIYTRFKLYKTKH